MDQIGPKWTEINLLVGNHSIRSHSSDPTSSFSVALWLFFRSGLVLGLVLEEFELKKETLETVFDGGRPIDGHFHCHDGCLDLLQIAHWTVRRNG